MAPGDERFGGSPFILGQIKGRPHLAFEVQKGYTLPFGTPEQDDKRGLRFDPIPADTP
jgi:hypothetical protein